MAYECDIILLSYESPALLKRCVESVLDHTRIDSRLIIVDNASKSPEVRDFLNGLSGAGRVKIEKVFSEENAGFAGGMNKGLRLSDAPFVCLLNNDCVVTDGWLEEMINVARIDERIGLVNPQSSTFGSRPDREASIDEHAFLLKDKKGVFVELGSAIGFACLIKREVIEKIGYLDEAYKGVCYEDTDFSERARKANFIPVMAEAAYVFHMEQASRKNLKERDDIYRANQNLFESRWGRLLRVFVFLGFSNGKDELSKVYEMLKRIARERAILEMWVSKSGKTGEQSGFTYKGGIVRHADIGVKIVPPKFMALKILWRVLTKKKRYDAVILPKGFLAGVLKLLEPLHRAVPFVLGSDYAVKSARGDVFSLKEPSLLVKYLRER